MQDEQHVGRRVFLKYGALAGLAVAGGATLTVPPSRIDGGRLDFRPRQPSKTITPGEHVMEDANGRRSILYVPPSYDATRPAPFLLALHGATGSGDSMLRGTLPSAEKHGVVVLSPSSKDYTWDAIRGSFSTDCGRIDRMLADVFDRCAIDPRHLGAV